MIPLTQEAFNLFHEGALALAKVEEAGIRIDVPLLKKEMDDIRLEIKEKEEYLKDHDFFHTWKKSFGTKTKLGSDTQLGHVLFNVMGYPCRERTAKTQRPKMTEDALVHIDSDFVQTWVEVNQLKLLRNNHLKGILNEVTEEGFVHPVINLNLARSYRSSEDTPNLQNVPTRNKAIAKRIRSTIIPRKGRQIGEADFKGIEVRIGNCYHKDPLMTKYNTDSSKDMHRDEAVKIFLLPADKITPAMRHLSKNQFVFPLQYGSFYVDCARDIWESLQIEKLMIPGTDTLVLEYLKSKGLRKLGKCDPDVPPVKGTFEYHMKEVENDYWSKYKIYARWKKEWYAAYQEAGGFTTLTGFRVTGLYSRNQVINYPVQGSAFHCLLKCLIKIQKWLTKRKMKTLIIGQIHDSILFDFGVGEMDCVLEKAQRVMTVELPKEWEWIIVPLYIEAQVAPKDQSWFEKKEVKVA